MARIVINNIQDLEKLQSKLRILKAVLPTIQKNAVKNASDDVLKEIKRQMKQENFSKKIIDATFLGKIERTGSILKQHFISNYVASTGFDVSNAREEGTNHPNPTFPKKPGGVLRWIAKTGDVIFRKKSHPKGIERLLIIERTLLKNQSTINEKISENISDSASRVLGV